MKRIFILVVLALISTVSVLASGLVSVTTTKGGELEALLGDKANEIDSLAVSGPINAADFKTMRKCSFFDVLKYIDLSKAEVEGNKIPDNAFAPEAENSALLKLERIILPEEITVIGKNAFKSAVNLKEIIFPSKLQEIEASAFEDARELKALVFPEGFGKIGERAFANSIESSYSSCVVLPSTTYYLGAECFLNTSVEIWCFAKTPPECGKPYPSAGPSMLMFPQESVKAYSETEWWNVATNNLFIAAPLTSGGMEYSNCSVAIDSGCLSSVAMEYRVGDPYFDPEKHIQLWEGDCEKFVKNAEPAKFVGANTPELGIVSAIFEDFKLIPGKEYTIVIPKGLFWVSYFGQNLFCNAEQKIKVNELMGVSSIAEDDEAAEETIYDLFGRRVMNPQPGTIYIVNGKKRMFNR